MVAKRELSPRFSADVSPKAVRRSQGQYDRHDVVSIHSRSNHSSSNRNSLTAANSTSVSNYSDTVAQSIQHKREKYLRAKATESIVVIAVNMALSLAAIAAITKLMPYQSSQKDRLDEITTEVNSVEQRVNGLREKLPETLNSGKTQETLLRKQGWIKSNQMTIKLLDPTEIASPNNDGVMPTTTTAHKNNGNNGNNGR